MPSTWRKNNDCYSTIMIWSVHHLREGPHDTWYTSPEHYDVSLTHHDHVITPWSLVTSTDPWYPPAMIVSASSIISHKCICKLQANMGIKIYKTIVPSRWRNAWSRRALTWGKHKNIFKGNKAIQEVLWRNSCLITWLHTYWSGSVCM